MPPLDTDHDSTLTSELRKRLDSIFQEDEPIEQKETAPVENKKEMHPLDSLKSALLSLDWEISDEVTGKFVEQAENFLRRYKADKVLSVFLQILYALGKYIRRYKGKSHPSSVKLVSTTFDGLVKVFDGGLSESEKRNLLNSTVDEFMKLKKIIIDEKKKVPPLEVKEAEVTEISKKTIQQLLMEIGVLIEAEFEKIRDEIRALNKPQT